MSKVKKDCFAYMQHRNIPDCRILKKVYCKEEEGKFYQSKYDVNLPQIEQDIRAYSNKISTKGAKE